MSRARIALANIPFPSTPDDAVTLARQAVAEAGAAQADVLCFPECYIPGYRLMSRKVQRVDQAFLERAWASVGEAAARAKVAVALGTERFVDGQLRISVIVFDKDGQVAGFQDKVQLDPSEDATYAPGSERRVFSVGPLTFGLSICHEGFRYPETVRWAARNGAQLVFHPHYHEAEAGSSFRPTTFADPANSFHEKAALCRAAENTCFYATVNCATDGTPTTSAIIRPDGTVQCYQPYGQPGLLVADIDLTQATRLLASRQRP